MHPTVRNVVVGQSGGRPVYLPASVISDFAIKGSASAYIDIGNMSLPAGDWCIGVCAAVPATTSTDFHLLSLGTQSDTILTDSGSLTIGWPGAAANAAFNYGWAAVGKDDAGVGLAPRTCTFFATSDQPGVSGPQQVAGAPDAVKRSFFIQKKNGVVSVWQIDTNCAAVKYSDQTTSFGAIASKPARLGCLGKLALSGFSAITYQRFFKTSQALTQYQMEAFAAGVDPRSVISFSAVAGDLLFAFSAAASDGQAYTDLIQGQAATAHGTFAVAAALLPTSVDQNKMCVEVDRYRVFQNNGATTDIQVSGTAYGASGDVQAALVNKSNGTIQHAYTTIGRSRNGRFSGVLTGVTTRLADYRIQVKKLVNGAQVGSVYLTGENYISTGPVICWLGQSLSEQMRTNNNYNISSGTLAFNGRYQASLYDATMRDHYPVGCSQQTGPGYGEGRLTQILGNALGFCNMQINSALAGSSIDQWLSDTSGYNSTSPLGVMTNAIADIQRFRPKYVIWHQGENSSGLSYAQYYSKLTQLYNTLSAAITWPWYFLIIPLDNNFTSSLNYDINFQAIRAATIDWADVMHAIDSKVVLACTVNDILSADTNGDGIHKNATVGGYGAYSERVAQTILFLEGNQTYSGLGPRITSAQAIGNTSTRVFVTHNGGTGLQTTGGGNPTGFQVSINGFSSTLAISATAIGGADYVDLTHATTGGTKPQVRYQWGLPGLGTTSAACGIDNALNDNRTPAINTARGYPVVPTTTAIQSV
jgi:hypothetical protein